MNPKIFTLGPVDDDDEVYFGPTPKRRIIRRRPPTVGELERKAQLEAMIQAYNGGATVTQVARQFGLQYHAAYKRLTRAGVTIKPAITGRPRKPITAERIAVLIENQIRLRGPITRQKLRRRVATQFRHLFNESVLLLEAENRIHIETFTCRNGQRGTRYRLSTPTT